MFLNHSPIFFVNSQTLKETLVFSFSPSSVLGDFVGSCKTILGVIKWSFVLIGGLTVFLTSVARCTNLNVFWWDFFQLSVWSQALRRYKFPLLVIGLVKFLQFFLHAKLSSQTGPTFLRDWASSLKLIILKYRFAVTSLLHNGTWLNREFALRDYFTYWMPELILNIWLTENDFFALHSMSTIFFV